MTWCWLGLHRWGLWAVTEEGELLRTEPLLDVPLLDSYGLPLKRRTGSYLVQERSCDICGKHQLDIQETQ
jgi:hypothetical protein